jgi:decaprenylphospho-beta-D-ribofuranose 2-oxidase
MRSLLSSSHRRGLKGTGPKKPDVDMKKRAFLRLITGISTSLVIGGLIEADIWDNPSRQWLLVDLFSNGEGADKLTLAPHLGTLLDDASHLNRSHVAEIRSPKTVPEVIKAIRDAQSTNRKISLSGVRHSMGGQALGLNTLHLDMTHLDGVRYNAADQTVTVGPGATWRQIQQVLSPHDRAVRVMQDSNIFSVGGSLSVNAHGKDPQYDSLIESVNYLKIVTADGQEVLCNRTQNKELFSAVIGGYGLFGVITEVNLLTTPNSTLSFSLIPIQTRSLIDKLEALSKNPENRLLEAHLSVDIDNFLTEGLIFQYTETKSSPRPKDELDGENSIWLRKVIFQVSRAGNLGKILRWEMEKLLSPLVEPKTLSRNTAMAVPVRFLQNPDPHSTDILQEYFVPVEQANSFLENYKKLLKKYAINLLNVTVRKVNKDTNALVSYAQQDMYGFVVYYKVELTRSDIQTLSAFTKELIDYLLSIKAMYYLCYGSYYSASQLTCMYPEIRILFALKTQHDPAELFTSVWYEKYRVDISHAMTR